MKPVVLISCSKLKRTYACETRLLYDASSLFSKSLAYAQIIADDIFVLSAKHGLVPLDEIIEPYEETLNDKSPAELAAWGKNVTGQLSRRYDVQNTEFVILAGQNYYQPLRPHLPKITLPLLGLPMGKRMAKLDALVKTGAQNQNQDSMCVRLHRLFNGMPRYKWDTISNIGFDNGIYVLFEADEKYNGMDRIVRVGTHRSDGRLRRRLKDHFVSENKDGSIFRKNIGKAILNKNKNSYLDVWSVDTSKPENIARLGDRYDPAFQKKVEETVTKYMREHFTFACFPVATEQDRLRFEEGIIAVLNDAAGFVASAEWRGRYSTEHEIVRSGLWLKQGLDGIPLTQNEYEKIATLCSGASLTGLRPIVATKIKQTVFDAALRHITSASGTKTSDIVDHLMKKMQSAKAAGSVSIRIKSGDIHMELGLASRMPMVCQAMRKLMGADDIIHYQPPKGNGSTLEIEYYL